MYDVVAHDRPQHHINSLGDVGLRYGQLCQPLFRLGLKLTVHGHESRHSRYEGEGLHWT